jgi:hypothetical protein
LTNGERNAGRIRFEIERASAPCHEAAEQIDRDVTRDPGEQ